MDFKYRAYKDGKLICESVVMPLQVCLGWLNYAERHQRLEGVAYELFPVFTESMVD